MFIGRRRAAASVGVPVGCVVEKTIPRCETTLVGGHPTALLSAAPNGPIGPKVAELEFVVLVVSVPDALLMGPGVAVGVGVGVGGAATPVKIGGAVLFPPLQAV
ncbi:MAG: hypothetical protein JO164_01630, partial [Candidatus Eremiobacteraeota bacterium]|nr:hypothetical protein [Candidatus Eremiobacteraeota bacterium]